jgi:hypothetical protein
MTRAAFAPLISDQRAAPPAVLDDMRRRAWTEQSIGVLYPHEIEDEALREKFIETLNRIFGQRKNGCFT